MKRIGLLGGSFNPVHRGHLKAAASVQEAFQMAAVVLIPSAMPPHKSPSGMASAEDRLKMLQMAASDLPRVQVCDIELRRSGLSYTIDTIRELKKTRSTGAELMFIVGEDAFFEINTWKHYRLLFQEVAFVVMTRQTGEDHGQSPGDEEMLAFLRAHVDSGYRRESPSAPRFVCERMQPVCRHVFDSLNISSTEIRRRARNGRPIGEMVPPGVEAYIRKKGLYR